MAPKIGGTTNPPSTIDDTEELTTESKCIHTAVSHPNQTSPELGPLTKVGECQKHSLVCATVSSLDKCVHCVGPVSSFKWLGYRCTVCSGVWHKSCLKQTKRDDFNSTAQVQQSPKASEDELLSDQDKIPHPELDQISSDDEDMSDKEYVPDSESEYDEDYDSDASIPLKSSQARAAHIQVKPVIPDVGTSYGSDTGTLLEALHT
ncbi:serine-aspartate repeat-containing protein G-like [Megalobrama amblycephala]|uniref:serine-aspartate repeat-containing protein G-like n=1 Tax=Megalobrama amblycephala TaxID=75352 RepID=UPI0020143B4A|nr:serine-aspartate repeat-containing protein G-like [Megalobrama amblycephala]